MVYILGDYMINCVNGQNVSNFTKVKVTFHPGATTEDLIDYVKSIARRKTKMLIIHTGKNDLPNDLNTIKKVKKALVLLIERNTKQKRLRNVTPN